MRVSDTGVGISRRASRERVRALLPGRRRRRAPTLRRSRPRALHQPRDHRRARRADLGGGERRSRVAGRSSASASRASRCRWRRPEIAPTGEPPAVRGPPSQSRVPELMASMRGHLDELAAASRPASSSASPPPSRCRTTATRMEASVAAGRMGRMGWMGGERPAVATDPRAHEPEARSVIVVAAPYVGRRARLVGPRPGALHAALAPVLAADPPPSRPGGSPATRSAATTTSRCAGRLEGLAADLRRGGHRDGRDGLCRRPAAGRAGASRLVRGLGWIGKNTNLLTHRPAGSWVFLGAILTSCRAAGRRARSARAAAAARAASTAARPAR